MKYDQTSLMILANDSVNFYPENEKSAAEIIAEAKRDLAFQDNEDVYRLVKGIAFAIPISIGLWAVIIFLFRAAFDLL